MEVAPDSMADKVIVLDDDDDGEEQSPQPSSSLSTPARKVSQLRDQQPVPTHITQSPFASAKKDRHVLQAENQRLFTEVRMFPSELCFPSRIHDLTHCASCRSAGTSIQHMRQGSTLDRCPVRPRTNRDTVHSLTQT